MAMRATALSRSARRDHAAPVGGGSALTLAGIAALLASGCCVMPLALVLIGVSGAWISQLHRLEPYSSWLAALALGSLGLAAWRLFRPAPNAGACAADEDVPCRSANVAARRWFWAIAVLTLIPLLVPLAAPLFY
jgi:mercuric ion transport protein